MLLTDIDEFSSNPCYNQGICNDGIDGFTCTCVDGYEGTLCQTGMKTELEDKYQWMWFI